ncbi:MAG: GAF domain-containing protein [Anaerolinea sp.]|nr:GAF domain-containing protein [Anaerolinea sp.]MCC6974482.1 GAF domain-containing protein [Anaerolineae bacterium]
MHPWFEQFFTALRSIESAEESAAVRSTLLSALEWLLESGAKISILTNVRQQNKNPLTREAVVSGKPQSSSDSRSLAFPLTVEDESYGVVYVETTVALSPQDCALAWSLCKAAGSALNRLSWPADPKVFRQLVENANVAIDVAALDGHITYANLAAAQLYGYDTPADLLKKSVSDLYFEDEEQRVAHDIISQSRTQEGWTGDVRHQTSDGAVLPVRLAVFGIRDHFNRLSSYGAIAQNLGEQQRLLISLRQQTQRLRAAAQVAKASISKLDLESLLLQVASVTQDLFNFDQVGVMLVDGDHLTVKIIYTSQGVLLPPQSQLPINETSLNGWVTLHGRPTLVNDTSQDSRYQTLEGMPEAGSELVVPLRLGERVIGTLDIQSAAINAFEHDDLETMQTIADQIAGAVDNARLFAAERFRVKQLAALNRISQMLVDVYNVDEVWDDIYEQIAGLFNVLTFFVIRYDPETGICRFIYLVDNGQVLPPPVPFPVGGLSGFVIRRGAPVLIDDLDTQREYLRTVNAEPLLIPGTRHARAFMGAPMRDRDGSVMGLISVQSDEPSVFTERDVEMLSTIVTQVSLALENVRLIEELSEAAAQIQIRAQRIESLYQIGTVLSASLDRERILTEAAEQIVNHFEVDHCAIMLAREDGISEIVAEYPETPLAGFMMNFTHAPILEHLRREDYLSAPDVHQSSLLLPFKEMIDQVGMKSALVLKMTAKGHLVGAVVLDTQRDYRTFSAEEIETVRAAVTQVSLAVDNADLYTQAVAANEMKSQFLATMSHELRTPLNAILGYTEMIMSGTYGALADKQADRLRRVYINAQHLLELINDVLDLAKIESGRLVLHWEPVEVPPLMTRVLHNVAPLAEGKPLVLDWQIPADLPILSADSIRLRQVLVNLASNAIKFTREGRITVWVVIAHFEEEEALMPLPEGISAAGLGIADGEYMLFLVRDTGIGIAPENFDLIFDAFRQVDSRPMREYQGTGLGLAISRQLVELHGGKLWVHSELGKGSTFVAALPLKRTEINP